MGDTSCGDKTMEKLDQPTARKFLAGAIEALQSNSKALSEARKESEASEDPMAKMKVMGLVTQILTPEMAKYGLPNVMFAVMQIAPYKETDGDIKAGTEMVEAAMKGALPSDEEVNNMVAKLRA